jgi:UDPglucose 6-dehydrogenase
MTHPTIVINKSTVPVGTGDWVSDIITRSQPEPIDLPWSVARNSRAKAQPSTTS